MICTPSCSSKSFCFLYGSLPTSKASVRSDLTMRYQGSGVSVANDGTIYFGTSDDDFHAVNSDGTQKWEVSLDLYTTDNNANPVSTPLIGSDGTLYIGTNTSLVALDPTNTDAIVVLNDLAGATTFGPTIENIMKAVPVLKNIQW